MRFDMLDYPTAWEIQARGVDHTTDQCSAVQSSGAFLCDCGAVTAEWERLREFRSLLDASSLGTPEARALIESTPPEVAVRIVERANEIDAIQRETPFEAVRRWRRELLARQDECGNRTGHAAMVYESGKVPRCGDCGWSDPPVDPWGGYGAETS